VWKEMEDKTNIRIAKAARERRKEENF